MRILVEFLRRRKLRKIVKHVLHDARHARHMRSDLAAPADLAALEQAEGELEDAWARGAYGAVDIALDRVVECAGKVYPPRPNARVRENVEILVVAVAVAMGFRTYFVQPFKIPTGSMQPTLYGITSVAVPGRQLFDYLPLSLVRMVLFGETYHEVRAKLTGHLSTRGQPTEDADIYFVDGIPHKFAKGIKPQVADDLVEKGQVLAAWRSRLGDHIFVNKIAYNFRRPRRGDIFVFSTQGIQDSRIRPDTFYIKRLAGLPGEEIGIDPPYLLADGKQITEPYPFKRLLTVVGEYMGLGYQLPPARALGTVKIGSPGDRLKLSDTQYLPLGDNTMYSLDGRYFGAVERQHIVGPAFMVYWPTGNRWGRVQ
jgi:signal peptidase I